MFRTEPILFLQQFASEPLTALMLALTSLGTQEFFVFSTVALLFGVDFRRGLIVMQVLLATLLLTVAWKHTLELPRPWAVDPRVERLEAGIPNSTPLPPSTRGWLEPLPAAAVRLQRQATPVDWGFPSGHTSSTLALWGAIAMLWRDRRLRALCGSLIVLVPLTRLYLGQHFLADLLGGFTLATIVLLTARAAVRSGRPVERLARWLGRSRLRPIALGAGLLVVTLAPLALGVPPEALTLIAGVQLGLLLVLLQGIPEPLGGRGAGVLRVAVALGLFVAVTLGAGLLGVPERFSGPVAGFALIVGGVALGRRLGLVAR